MAIAKSRQHVATPDDPIFRSCSLLMALLFGVSGIFQFNDPDWYFWIPLYASACAVNLMNGLCKLPAARQLAKFALWLGLFLFVKVVLEDILNGVAGFWSLDMREKVVREKLGSGLVIISSSLQLKTTTQTAGTPKKIALKYVDYGMLTLVGVGYGLSFCFFGFQQKEMKF